MESQFTTKSQEALSAAVKDAVERGNSQVEPAHILFALLSQPDSIASALLELSLIHI